MGGWDMNGRKCEGERWRDDNVDDILLNSSWSTPVPLGAAPWGIAHTGMHQAFDPGKAEVFSASKAQICDIDDRSSNLHSHKGAAFHWDDDHDSLSRRLSLLLLEFDRVCDLPSGTCDVPFGTTPALEARDTLVSASPGCSDAVAMPPADPRRSPTVMSEALAAELVGVMSQCCARLQDDEGNGEDGEGRKDDVLRACVWIPCLPPPRNSRDVPPQGGFPLRQEHREERPSERFFTMICRLMGRRDAPVGLVRQFCRHAVLPRLLRLQGAASRSLIDALARLASLRPSLVLTHVLVPLLCQPAGSLGSVQCEAVARVIKQGCFGMGEEGSGGFGGRRGVYLEKLLRGLCGWDLSLNLGDERGNGAQERKSPEVVEGEESRGLEGNEKEGRSEKRRGGGGLEHGRAMLYPVCEWTDVTLPVLTAVLGQRPTLSDETVLVVLERLRAALEGGGDLMHSFKLAALINALQSKYGPQIQLFPTVMRHIISICEEGEGRDGAKGGCSNSWSKNHKNGGGATLIRNTLRKVILSISE